MTYADHRIGQNRNRSCRINGSRYTTGMVGFAARFNSYRFSVNDNASTFIKTAYTALCRGVDEATPVEYTLTQESAMAINNIRALHCRDVIKDNRRVLVRIFGLSKFSSPLVISENPLLLQG